MSGYADSSFLVSLYAMDVNSPPASKVMRRAVLPIFITPLGELELSNALYLRIFRKELGLSEIRSALGWFRETLPMEFSPLSPFPPAALNARSRSRANKQCI